MKPVLRPSLAAFRDVPRMLKTTLLGRCPACGQASVFAGVYRLKRTCPSCQVRFERDPGHFLGALAVAYGLGVLTVAVLAAVLVWRFGLFTGLEWALIGASLAAVPLLYRPAKAWWLWWTWAAGFVYRDDDRLDPRL